MFGTFQIANGSFKQYCLSLWVVKSLWVICVLWGKWERLVLCSDPLVSAWLASPAAHIQGGRVGSFHMPPFKMTPLSLWTSSPLGFPSKTWLVQSLSLALMLPAAETFVAESAVATVTHHQHPTPRAFLHKECDDSYKYKNKIGLIESQRGRGSVDGFCVEL